MRLSIRPGCHVSQAVESNASVTAPATERLVSLAIFGLLESARGITSIFARRIVFELLGWLLHILIDIPTHSFSYYATRLLWPVSDYRIDGIALWTPWFWAATYGALGLRGSCSGSGVHTVSAAPRSRTRQSGAWYFPINRLAASW